MVCNGVSIGEPFHHLSECLSKLESDDFQEPKGLIRIFQIWISSIQYSPQLMFHEVCIKSLY